MRNKLLKNETASSKSCLNSLCSRVYLHCSREQENRVQTSAEPPEHPMPHPKWRTPACALPVRARTQNSVHLQIERPSAPGPQETISLAPAGLTEPAERKDASEHTSISVQVNQILTCREGAACQHFALRSSEVAPAPQAPVAAGSQPSPREGAQCHRACTRHTTLAYLRGRPQSATLPCVLVTLSVM